MYHGNALGSGISSVHVVATQRRAWTSRTLDGQLYGEPLAWSGLVYVATENNTVYALSARNGAIAWARHVAQSVVSSSLPCGNVAPRVGITGTPVIDPGRHEIFVVAETVIGAQTTHELIGLNARTGSVMMTQLVDPPRSDPAALLQRAGLALDKGRVIIAFGGLYGDCGHYHGTVEAVPEMGGRSNFYTVAAASGQSQGAVWMGGAAPIVDPRGDVWVSVGNGAASSPSEPYDYSDSLLDLSPTLHLRHYFAPRTWAQDNASDLDMSMAPALLANGQVIVAGKSRIAYVLRGVRLGGIGGEETSVASGCSQDIDGGPAYVGSVVYLPCLSGPIAVRVSVTPPALHVLWSATVGGGPPIFAAGEVWTIGSDGVLYGLSAANGIIRQHVFVGNPANHFPTPSVGDGLMLVANATRVLAFATR